MTFNISWKSWKEKKIMTHEIGMMTSSNQPPAGHNKYYFLKFNIKDYYDAKFQVYVIFSPPPTSLRLNDSPPLLPSGCQAE